MIENLLKYTETEKDERINEEMVSVSEKMVPFFMLFRNREMERGFVLYYYFFNDKFLVRLPFCHLVGVIGFTAFALSKVGGTFAYDNVFAVCLFVCAGLHLLSLILSIFPMLRKNLIFWMEIYSLVMYSTSHFYGIIDECLHKLINGAMMFTFLFSVILRIRFFLMFGILSLGVIVHLVLRYAQPYLGIEIYWWMGNPTVGEATGFVFTFIVLNVLVMCILYLLEHEERIVYIHLKRVENRNKRLKYESYVTKMILYNVAPREFVEHKSRLGGEILFEKREYCAVVSADLVEFTQLCTELSSKTVISLLNKLFKHYDVLVKELRRSRVKKLKTLGDCFIATCYQERHTEPLSIQMLNDVLIFSVLVVQILKNLRSFHETLGKVMQIRVGVCYASGYLGFNVSRRGLHFELYGDAYRRAVLLENNGTSNCINVSDELFQLTKDAWFYSQQPTMTTGTVKTDSDSESLVLADDVNSNLIDGNVDSLSKICRKATLVELMKKILTRHCPSKTEKDSIIETLELDDRSQSHKQNKQDEDVELLSTDTTSSPDTRYTSSSNESSSMESLESLYSVTDGLSKTGKSNGVVTSPASSQSSSSNSESTSTFVPISRKRKFLRNFLSIFTRYLFKPSIERDYQRQFARKWIVTQIIGLSIFISYVIVNIANLALQKLFGEFSTMWGYVNFASLGISVALIGVEVLNYRITKSPLLSFSVAIMGLVVMCGNLYYFFWIGEIEDWEDMYYNFISVFMGYMYAAMFFNFLNLILKIVACLVLFFWFCFCVYHLALFNSPFKNNVVYVAIERQAIDIFLLYFGVLCIAVFLESVRRSSFLFQRKSEKKKNLIEKTKNQNQDLISSVIPPSVVQRLSTEDTIEDDCPEAFSVFFNISNLATSDDNMFEVVNFYVELYDCLDRIVNRHKCRKIKTTQNSYFFVELQGDICRVLECLRECVHDFEQFVQDWEIEDIFIDKKSCGAKIGLYRGRITLGLIGFEKLSYDAISDCVNSSARLASSCNILNHVHIQEDNVGELVHEAGFEVIGKGEVFLKGKGEVVTAYVKLRN